MPRRTVVDPQFPARLRQLRKARGLSQQGLARTAFVSKSYISELENGLKAPGVATAKALDTALQADGELARMVTEASPPVRSVGDPQDHGMAVVFADQVRHAVEEQLDEGLPYADRLDRLQHQVTEYAREVATVAPMEMIERLTPRLIDAQQMLRYARTSADTQHLRRVLARLSSIVADEYSVIGDVDASRAWHATAAAAADRAASPRLQAAVRALAAMLPLYHGPQTDAIRVAQQARKLASEAGCFAVSLGAMLEALARARLGDHDRARLALRRSREAHDDMDSADTAESFFGFSVRRRLFYEGRLLTMVGDYAAAADAHEQARRLYPAAVVGDPAIMDLDQASALIGTKDTEAGADLIVETLSGLPADHQIGVFVSVAAGTFGAIPVAERKLPAARACAELLDEMTHAG